MNIKVLDPVDLAPAASSGEDCDVAYLREGGFARVDEEFTNPDEAKKILNYIAFLANQAATSADNLKLPYKKGEKKEWKLTRPEVNVLFFSHIENKGAEKAPVRLPDEKEQARILEALSSRAEETKNELIDIERRALEDSLSAMRNMDTHLRTAWQARLDIEGYSNGDAHKKRMSDLMAGLPSTNWSFESLSGNFITFVSRTEIFLSYHVPASKLHYDLNCGFFRCEIDMSTMHLRVFGHKNAAPNGRYPHPHITAEGDVCFGNGNEAARMARALGNILGLLQLLDKMLPHYGTSPFINIEDFKRILDQRDAAAKRKLERDAAIARGECVFEDQDVLDDEYNPDDESLDGWEPEFNEDSDEDSNDSDE